MKILFIQHSCFVVEIENKVLIFDWFDKARITGYAFQGILPEFSKEKEIYLFASHKHQDHFDLNALKWENTVYSFKGYPAGRQLSGTQWNSQRGQRPRDFCAPADEV